MIPQFPTFKKLELSDREAVMAITKDFPPYSDFNFTSMFSWNTQGQIQLSILNGNFVVKFTDYVTNDDFYSFLGNSKVNETVDKLLKRSLISNLQPELKLVPEISLAGLDTALFSATPDRDNFDYIFSTSELCDYKGSVFAKKRNYVKRFLKDNPSCEFKILDIGDSETRTQILDTFSLWLKEKNMSIYEAEHEMTAVYQCFMLPYDNFVAMGISHNKKLIAFWLIEILDNKYAMSHFEKAAFSSYVGIYQFLRQQGARTLEEKNISFINLEQDLGVAGLRTSKESYNPCGFLRKYVIRPV